MVVTNRKPQGLDCGSHLVSELYRSMLADYYVCVARAAQEIVMTTRWLKVFSVHLNVGKLANKTILRGSKQRWVSSATSSFFYDLSEEIQPSQVFMSTAFFLGVDKNEIVIIFFEKHPSKRGK